jgi:hypothetical protein
VTIVFSLPIGEVHETKYSRFCPYCYKTQMVVKGVKTTYSEDLPTMEQTTLIWKCPVCVEDFSEA